MTKPTFSIWASTAIVGCLLATTQPLHAQRRRETYGASVNENEILIRNSQVQIRYGLLSGTMEIAWKDGHKLLGVMSAATLENGRSLSTDKYPNHVLDPIEDGMSHGRLQEFTIRSTGNGQPPMLQHIWLNADEPWIELQAELDPEASRVGTRHFDALLIHHENPVQIAPTASLRILHVPFDNDMWFRFASVPVDAIKDGELFSSEEVTAIYDNTTREGIVIGSVTHDTWKTAIDAHALHSRLVSLDVYGGISAPDGVRSDTHDILPHGLVHGVAVRSPRIFIGSFADWRDGLEAYGNVNAAVQPPLAWQGKAPVGWNSWAAYGGKIDYQRYLGAAQFVHETLVPEGFGKSRPIYINLDAFWSRLDAAQLEDAVANIRAMKASDGTHFEPGIYWTSFAYWSDNLDAFVEGTGMQYRYRDILLKTADGRLMPKIDGGRPIDPSHPGTKERTAFYMKEFRKLGFRYLKLDFLSHGALEGTHYDPAIQTGIQAYNMGMKQIVQEAGGQMFLSLSISPLFPSGYGHARRLSCDTKGHISGKEQSTEYMLNALTYGWWTNKRLYILDPDHVVLGEHGDLGARSVDEGDSRLLSAIISGGMVLDSSPLADDSQARDFAKAVYNKPEWFEIASGGEAFRPIEGDTGSAAASAFVRSAGSVWYLAVFNYDDKNSTTVRIPLARILPEKYAHNAVEVIESESGKTETTSGETIAIDLGPAQARLLAVVPKPESR